VNGASQIAVICWLMGPSVEEVRQAMRPVRLQLVQY